MTAEGNGSQGAGQSGERSGVVSKQIEGWARTLLTALVIGVPTALINGLNSFINRSLIVEPWRALFFMGPLAVLGWWCWRMDRRGGALRLRRPFALFLLCYLSVFTLAASSDVLVWRRTLVGFDEARPPGSGLTPARLGDWRYIVARRPELQSALLVITMEPPAGEQKLESGRFQLAHMIAAAAAMGARGIALDFYFDSIPSEADVFVCEAVAEAQNGGMPVVLGYALDTEARPRIPRREPPDLAECLRPFRRDRGHLYGYREPDERVRSVPLRLVDPPGSEALGFKVAAAMAGQDGRDLAVPDTDLLHFLEPAVAPAAMDYADVVERHRDDVRALFEGRFLLVGERSDRERFQTPYGERLGVVVHANVIQSLLAGRFMRRTPWWSSLLVIGVACFVLTHLAANGAPRRRLVEVAALISGLIIAAAVGLAYFGVWVDVVYVIAAVWPLAALLAWRSRKMQRSTAAAPRALQPAGGTG